MKKIELSQKQLIDRTLFVEKLQESSWNIGEWENLFNENYSLIPEAVAEYQKGATNIRLSYYISDCYFTLDCYIKNEQKTYCIRLYPKNDFITLLDKITQNCNIISTKDWVNLISSLMPYCNLVLLEVAEGMIEIS